MITYIIFYLLVQTLICRLVFAGFFHPVNIFNLWTLCPFLLYYLRPYSEKITYSDLDSVFFALIILSSGGFFLGAATTFLCSRLFRNPSRWYSRFREVSARTYIFYCFGLVLLAWSGYYLYETYTYVYSSFDFSNRIGLRSSTAFKDTGFASRWWIEESALALLMLLSVYNAYNIFFLRRFDIILNLVNWVSVLLYVFATLGRGRLIDVVMVYSIMYAASKGFSLRHTASAKLIFYLAVFISIYIVVSYVRTDESLYVGSYASYFLPHITQYFTNGISFTQQYLNQTFEGANGSYSFRFIYLLLNNVGFDIPTDTPRYGVYFRGELVTFNTPSMLTWINDDFGIVGVLLFYYIYGTVAVVTYNRYVNSYSMSNCVYMSILFLFMFKSLLTYPFYDLWFWIFLITAYPMTTYIYRIEKER